MPAPIALVSGGSRGIGREIVLELSRRGFDVAFGYRGNVQAADEVSALVSADGRRVQSTACDVADTAAVASWVQSVERELGPVDVLVNCAGITRDAPAVMMSAQQWDEVIATNLRGAFNVCRSVAFGMLKRRRGCIVNLSSVSGVYGNVGQSNYAASKAGVIGFSRSLAKELAPHGVRVNVVAPGLIDTDMTAVLPAGTRDRLTGRIPLGRMGNAAEVARAVAFLASDEAGYITGQVLGVDGGLVI